MLAKASLLGLFLLSIAQTAMCQREATLFFIKLMKDGRNYSSDTARHHAFLQKYREASSFEIHDSSFTRGLGSYYQGEIVQLTFTIGTDTMLIRLRQDMTAPGVNANLVTVFRFDVPFQKGYFEIPQFEQVFGAFVIPKEFKWKAIPFSKRTLRNEYLE